MEKLKAVEVLIISLNQDIPFIGKLWLAVFVFFRVFVLLFAGFPLFWDEGEHFVCNTIQPGCASVCFDAFVPLSLCRFGFLHLVCVCLPTALYVTHHTHRVLTAFTCKYFMKEDTPSLRIQMPVMKGPGHSSETDFGGCVTVLYVLHVILRIFLELAFGVAQYFLFGLSVRRDFLCLQAPCRPTVECFASRPTEKTLLMQWLLGNAVLSVFLSVAEISVVLRRSVQKKRNRKWKRTKREVNDRSG